MDSRHPVTEPDRRSWHLDKTLNVSHLLATVAVAGSLFAYANNMDRRVAILEEKMQVQQQVMASTNDSVRALALDVRDEIRLLRSEIIRLTEKTAGGNGK